MKGALTLLVLAAGHASAEDDQGVSCWQNHVDFRGDDIERADGSTGGVVVDTALECQSLCQRHFPCTHWTWRFEGKCFMKSGADEGATEDEEAGLDVAGAAEGAAPEGAATGGTAESVLTGAPATTFTTGAAMSSASRPSM